MSPQLNCGIRALVKVAKSWKMGLDDWGGGNGRFMGLFPFLSESLSLPFIGLLDWGSPPLWRAFIYFSQYEELQSAL